MVSTRDSVAQLFVVPDKATNLRQRRLPGAADQRQGAWNAKANEEAKSARPGGQWPSFVAARGACSTGGTITVIGIVVVSIAQGKYQVP